MPKKGRFIELASKGDSKKKKSTRPRYTVHPHKMGSIEYHNNNQNNSPIINVFEARLRSDPILQEALDILNEEFKDKGSSK